MAFTSCTLQHCVFQTEAMRAFCAPEVLDGNNQFYCERCQTKRDAHKVTCISYEIVSLFLTLMYVFSA